MRASVDDRALATLNGARPARVAMLAWAIGAILAAVGGILIAPEQRVERPDAVAAHRERLRGRDLRPAAQPPAHVRRRHRARAHRRLPRRVHARTASISPACASRRPAILLFLVLLVIPNPRLRGRVRTREYFPAPSWSGALDVRGDHRADRRRCSRPRSEQRRRDDLREHLPDRDLRAVAGPAHGLRGADLAVPALVRRHRRGGVGTVGHARQPARHARARRSSRPWSARSIALPALRLSGIYLALATAGFAVALDNWIWTLPPIRVFGLFTLNLFQTGQTSAAPAEAVRLQLRHRRPRRSMLLSVVLALMTLVVVWIRRSSFGRRLLAMKDSEAACATLGMRLIGAKTAIFAISAGMAGLGGALYASELQSIVNDRFSFITGLPDLHARGDRRHRVRRHRHVLRAVARRRPAAAQPARRRSARTSPACCPASPGIGLGRNPNGALADMRDAFGRAWRDKRDLRRAHRRRARDLVAARRARVPQLAVRDPRRSCGRSRGC